MNWYFHQNSIWLTTSCQQQQQQQLWAKSNLDIAKSHIDNMASPSANANFVTGRRAQKLYCITF